MKISLTRRYLQSRLQYRRRTGEFVWRDGPRAGQIAGCRFENGYINIALCDRMIGAHRLAFLYVVGAMPKQVEHKNGKPWDNRWANLRSSTQSQNKQNARVKATSKSGFKGVTWKNTHNKWAAHIGPRGGVRFLGHFDSPTLAHAAYVAAAKQMYGDFARR